MGDENMKCQKCNIREANVHLVKSVNGIKKEIHMCDKCAAEDMEMGELTAGLGQSSLFGLGNLLSGLFSAGYSLGEQEPISLTGSVKCKKCGMSLQEFKNNGTMGCDECYEAFGKNIEPLLKRLHGSVVHKGRVPGKIEHKIKADREIDRLKELLNKAICEEAYEKAAELRDEIKALERAKEESEQILKKSPVRNSIKYAKKKNIDNAKANDNDEKEMED